jgi:hypothetical protein
MIVIAIICYGVAIFALIGINAVIMDACSFADQSGIKRSRLQRGLDVYGLLKAAKLTCSEEQFANRCDVHMKRLRLLPYLFPISIALLLCGMWASQIL